MKTTSRLLGLVAGLGLAGLLSLASLPAMAGMWSTLPAATTSPTALNAATLPLTGNEIAPFDTLLSGGRNPQTETISVDQLKVYMFGNLGSTTAVTLALNAQAAVSDYGTCNSGRCVLTSSSLTLATSGYYTPTVLNSTVTTSSIVNCSAQRGTSATGIPALVSVRTGTGVFTPIIQNQVSPLTGTVVIACTVVN